MLRNGDVSFMGNSKVSESARARIYYDHGGINKNISFLKCATVFQVKIVAISRYIQKTFMAYEMSKYIEL